MMAIKKANALPNLALRNRCIESGLSLPELFSVEVTAAVA